EDDTRLHRYTAPPPPRLLRRPQPRPALAPRGGPLPRLGLGGHAPADARRGRHSVLRALDATLPDAGGARRGRRRRRAPRVAGARLLRPRPQPPPRGTTRPRTVPWPDPRRRRGVA